MSKTGVETAVTISDDGGRSTSVIQVCFTVETTARKIIIIVSNKTIQSRLPRTKFKSVKEAGYKLDLLAHVAQLNIQYDIHYFQKVFISGKLK